MNLPSVNFSIWWCYYSPCFTGVLQQSFDPAREEQNFQHEMQKIKKIKIVNEKFV